MLVLLFLKLFLPRVKLKHGKIASISNLPCRAYGCSSHPVSSNFLKKIIIKKIFLKIRVKVRVIGGKGSEWVGWRRGERPNWRNYLATFDSQQLATLSPVYRQPM